MSMMNRRGFLGAALRLGAAVAASPLLNLLPESQQDRFCRLVREMREKHMRLLAEMMESYFWGPPALSTKLPGIDYWIRKNPVQFRGHRYRVPIA